MNSETILNEPSTSSTTPTEPGSEVAAFDETRLAKRRRLLERTNPYPYSWDANQEIELILRRAEELEAQDTELNAAAEPVVIRGRIWSRRDMGRSSFIDVKDSTGKVQVYLQSKILSDDDWAVLNELDLGDLIGIRGLLFRTRSGELSVKAQGIQCLAKAVVPIPIGKEFGDQVRHRANDPELRYRHRYQHWMLDDRDFERVRLRTKIISLIRQAMEAEGFLDVQTPTIEPVYGGAEARPFATEVWALGGQTAYLRISPELYLKRYLVAGFPKVFTICQNFRNEGIDSTHNPEFTMMEWYESGTDYVRQMERFEQLVASICRSVHGTTRITYQSREIDFAPPWRRLTLIDGIKELGGVDVNAMSAAQVVAEIRKHRQDSFDRDLSWGQAVAELFELVCETALIQPTFVTDHPVDISPLTKLKRGDHRLVERFEPFVCGMELGNAYSELTDPVAQWERLAGQRDGENDEDGYEDHPVDLDFVRAIGCGMPPTGGVGLGIDRLIMLLTDAPSIRDIIPFPMLRI